MPRSYAYLTGSVAAVVTISLAACSAPPQRGDGQPPSSLRFPTELVLRDAALADVTDLRVELDAEGVVHRILVAGSGGVAELGPDLRVARRVTWEQGPFNPVFVDLDGDGTPELLERGNSVSVRPIGARSLDGRLLWQIACPLKPSDFAHEWVHAVDRDRDGKSEVLVGVKGSTRVAVLDWQGKQIDLIEWDRMNTEESLIFADVDGDGIEDGVYGSDGALVARDAYGRQLFRSEMPTPGAYSRFVSVVRRVDDANSTGPTFWLVVYSRDPATSGEAIHREFLVGGDRRGDVREIEAGLNHPWSCEHALLGSGIGSVRVTHWWGMGIESVVICKEDGAYLGLARFAGAGHGPCGNIIEPGVAVVVRLPGAAKDSILVGVGDSIWLVDPVPIDAPRFSPEERALLESIPKKPKSSGSSDPTDGR